MSVPVTTEPKTSHKPAKRERISPRVAEAVRLLTTGECKTQKAAAERVGLNVTYLCEALAKPKVQVFIAREAQRNIQRGTMRASARLIELIDAQSEHVAAKVSERVLEENGILKVSDRQAQVSVNVGVSVGYVVDLSHGAVMAHDRGNEAKPLIEHDPVGNDDGERR